MAIYQKVIKSGPVTEIEQYESVRTVGKRIPRSKNKRSTDAEQMERNRVNARKYLCRLINANFSARDLNYSLDYAGDEPTKEEAKRYFKNFIERVRYWCKKNKVILRYIERTENTQSRDGRIHHHVVMSRVPMELIFELWKHGDAHMERVGAEIDKASIANYIDKEDATPFERRWSRSRNLKKPEIERKVITKKKAYEIIRCPRGYMEVARTYEHSPEGGYHQYTKFVRVGGLDFGEQFLKKVGEIGGLNARAGVRANNIGCGGGSPDGRRRKGGGNV